MRIDDLNDKKRRLRLRGQIARDLDVVPIFYADAAL
jgi:hypothetical protein